MILLDLMSDLVYVMFYHYVQKPVYDKSGDNKKKVCVSYDY